MAIKKKEGERLDDASIEAMIAIYESEKPCTIKAACEMLNIAANGARLKKIIEDFKERRAEDKRRRAANRGKPASDFEISTIVEGYLGGESLKDIADNLYRTTEFVKRVVDEVGVPSRIPAQNWTNFPALPDQCVAERFEVGELVWNSKTGRICKITRDEGISKAYGVQSYSFYEFERVDPEKMLIDGKRYDHMPSGKFGGRHGAGLAYDLGSLRHLQKYVPDLMRIVN